MIVHAGNNDSMYNGPCADSKVGVIKWHVITADLALLALFQSMGYVIFSGYLLNNTGRMDALSVAYRGGQHLLVPLLLQQP